MMIIITIKEANPGLINLKVFTKPIYLDNQDIVKNGEIYFETALHANDWTKRMVFMTADFLYYSYSSQDTDENRSLANFTPETENAPRITDLHHSEPYVDYQFSNEP